MPLQSAAPDNEFSAEGSRCSSMCLETCWLLHAFLALHSMWLHQPHVSFSVELSKSCGKKLQIKNKINILLSFGLGGFSLALVSSLNSNTFSCWLFGWLIGDAELSFLIPASYPVLIWVIYLIPQTNATVKQSLGLWIYFLPISAGEQDYIFR